MAYSKRRGTPRKKRASRGKSRTKKSIRNYTVSRGGIRL